MQEPGGAGWRAWVLASRPKTLPAAVVPVLLGGWLARSDVGGEVAWGLVWLALGCAICIQIATNLFNDVIDADKGADGVGRLGPVRVTQSGLLARRAVWGAAAAMLVLAGVLALPLLWERGWLVLAIGLPSLYFCYGYTGGPVPLAYRGLGELFVVLFFGLVAVGGSYFVAVGGWSWGAVVLGVQVGALSTVLLAVNNLRDIEGDRGVGKMTLAARYGVRFGRMEILILVALPQVVGSWWWVAGDWRAWLWPMGALVAGVPVVVGVMRQAPGAGYNRLLGLAGLQLLLFGALWAMGIGW